MKHLRDMHQQKYFVCYKHCSTVRVYIFGQATTIEKSEIHFHFIATHCAGCTQAGDNHHFHPTCARCSKCGDPFGDGEEMFLQGAAIWHPRCGPAPNAPLDLERASSEMQVHSTFTFDRYSLNFKTVYFTDFVHDFTTNKNFHRSDTNHSYFGRQAHEK